jgi:ppGpp synthetase/RelA/SpoT-type nucleotidyltranferase
VKIPASIRSLHGQLLERQSLLKQQVDALVNGRKQMRWHYESRTKELESFALKLETGRVASVKELEDFFACTIVVENRQAIGKALELVRQLFQVEYMRPESMERTSKRATDFPFDDLRVYARWREDESYPRTPVEGILFEIQIKTFLQHAWMIATHDLVYKTERPSWPKARIAFQIKAMLEHAEASILGAEELAALADLKMIDDETSHVLEVLSFVERHWDASQLPKDRVRLAENIVELMKALRVDLSELEGALDKESAEGRGDVTLNLSPYATLLQTILKRFPEKVAEFLKGKERDTKGRRRGRVLVVPEVEGCDVLLMQDHARVVSVPSAPAA